MKLFSYSVVALVAVAVGVAVTAATFMLRGRAATAPIIINTPPPSPIPEPTATPSPMQVHVAGEVAHPDVYALPPGSRIKQAIEAAGGFTSRANTEIINLAQPLADGVQIYVPAIDEAPDRPSSVYTGPALPQRSGTGFEVPGDGLVNINLATLEELDTLPGIGPATAQKILDYRAANGPFASIEEIMDVPGIGEGKFEQLRALITVGN